MAHLEQRLAANMASSPAEISLVAAATIASERFEQLATELEEILSSRRAKVALGRSKTEHLVRAIDRLRDANLLLSNELDSPAPDDEIVRSSVSIGRRAAELVGKGFIVGLGTGIGTLVEDRQDDLTPAPFDDSPNPEAKGTNLIHREQQTSFEADALEDELSSLRGLVDRLAEDRELVIRKGAAISTDVEMSDEQFGSEADALEDELSSLRGLVDRLAGER